MGAPQLEHLDAVLHGAQEGIGLVQGLTVATPHISALGQASQRAQGGGWSYRLVGAPVHHLEQLDCELHVAQATGTQLQLSRHLISRDVVQDPTPHGLDFLDETITLDCSPDHWIGHRNELAAQINVSGNRTSLEKRLELPSLGPALVVTAVAGQGAHQRTAAAFWAQIWIDRPNRAFGSLIRTDLHHRRCDPSCRFECGLLTVSLDGLGDEEHVYITDVVELMSTTLAHGNYG